MTLENELRVAWRLVEARSREAGDAVGRVLATAPDHPEALLLAARYERSRGESAAALRLVDAVLATDPEYEAAGVLRTWVLLDRQEATAAVATAERTVHAHPRSPEARLALSHALAALPGGASRAVDVALDVLGEQPDGIAVRFALGRAYLAAGDRDQAARAYREILAVQPDDRTARHNLEVVIGRDPMASLRTLGELLAEDPSSDLYQRNVARTVLVVLRLQQLATSAGYLLAGNVLSRLARENGGPLLAEIGAVGVAAVAVVLLGWMRVRLGRPAWSYLRTTFRLAPRLVAWAIACGSAVIALVVAPWLPPTAAAVVFGMGAACAVTGLVMWSATRRSLTRP
jgi:tetratricopeptide (TPR) repeat protein